MMLYIFQLPFGLSKQSNLFYVAYFERHFIVSSPKLAIFKTQ